MRTPSRSAFLYAMGLLAATGAAGIVGISSANASPSHASPSHARSAPASVSMTVPGTGVTVTTDMDDNGDVMDTTAGDDANDQNETEANDVNDDNSAPAPGATETADSSGNDANDASDANDANDDQGDEHEQERLIGQQAKSGAPVAGVGELQPPRHDGQTVVITGREVLLYPELAGLVGEEHDRGHGQEQRGAEPA